MIIMGKKVEYTHLDRITSDLSKGSICQDHPYGNNRRAKDGDPFIILFDPAVAEGPGSGFLCSHNILSEIYYP